MIKSVWNDWFLQRKDATERLRRMNEHGFSPIIVLGAAAPMAGSLAMREGWQSGVICGLENLLLFLLMSFHIMYPGCMSKVMLLVPTNKIQKRKYVKTEYFMKTAIFLLAQLLLVFEAVWIGAMPWENGIMLCLSLAMFSLTLGVASPQKGKFVGVLCCVVLGVSFAIIEGSMGTKSVFGKTEYIESIILLVLQWGLGLRYLIKQWNPFLEGATTYQPIEEKVKL